MTSLPPASSAARKTRATGLRALAALMSKDLRLLRPLFLGLILLNLIATGAELAFNSPDESNPPGREAAGPVAALIEVAVGMAVAFIGALMAFVGERETKSDRFVATLPVEPRRIFISKFLVLAAVLIASTWFSGALEHLLATANPDSVTRRHFTFRGFLLEMSLGSWLAIVVSAHAVWLSWLGRMGWLLISLATALTGLLPVLDARLVPWGLPEAVTLQHHGVDPIVQWRALVFHSVLALLALWAGLRLWLSDSERAQRFRFPRLRRFGRTAGFVLAGAVAFVVVLAIALAPSGDDEGNGDAENGKRERADTKQRRTFGRFTFSYESEDEEKAAALMARANAAYEDLQGWFGVRGPDEVIVDLTYRGVELGGLALGARMNVDVDRSDEIDALAAVFLHELVHVFQNHLTGNRPSLPEASLRFFSEGMAEHITFSLRGLEEARAQGWRRAAWAQARYNIRLRDLFDTSTFVAQFDERWLYDFGELYADAVTRICGKASHARIYRRLAEGTGSAGLRGEALLRVLLADKGCSLERVQAQVQTTLAQLAPEATSLATLRARYQHTRRGSLEFELRLRDRNADADSVTTPYGAFVMVRRDSSASPREYVGNAVELTGPSTRVSIEADHLDQSRFQYRVGLMPPWGGGHLFTRWRTTTSR